MKNSIEIQELRLRCQIPRMPHKIYLKDFRLLSRMLRYRVNELHNLLAKKVKQQSVLFDSLEEPLHNKNRTPNKVKVVLLIQDCAYNCSSSSSSTYHSEEKYTHINMLAPYLSLSEFVWTAIAFRVLIALGKWAISSKFRSMRSYLRPVKDQLIPGKSK